MHVHYIMKQPLEGTKRFFMEFVQKNIKASLTKAHAILGYISLGMFNVP